jgi:hypothetical protein
MLSERELLGLLGTAESQFLERKESCPKRAELRQTLCAFANSTPEGQRSVLLIGVTDKGVIKGIANAEVDATQKTIQEIGREDCYPPIRVFTQVVVKDGKQVIAAVVDHSEATPHFTGHSYIRVGPTSRKTDPEQFEELISIRNDKVRRIISAKAIGPISVEWTNRPPVIGAFGARGTKWLNLEDRDYQIAKCDSFVLHMIESPSGNNIPVPLEEVVIGYDAIKYRMKLIIEFKFLRQAEGMGNIQPR